MDKQEERLGARSSDPFFRSRLHLVAADLNSPGIFPRMAVQVEAAPVFVKTATQSKTAIEYKEPMNAAVSYPASRMPPPWRREEFRHWS
jgi:hypothetical protein